MKNLIKLMILPACFGLSLHARAEEGTNSELFHQADEGKFEFTAGIGRAAGKAAWTNTDGYGFGPNGFTFANTSVRNSSMKYSETLTPVAISGEYGINSMLAVGLDLTYGSDSVKATNPDPGYQSSLTQSGLYNPTLYLKGKYDLGGGSLVYGVYVDIGLEKHTEDSKQNTNLATGGSTLTPYVGWQMAAGPGVWGIRVQDDVYKTDAKWTVNSQDSTVTGGNKLVVDTFYESDLGSFTLGGDLFYQSVGSTSKKASGASSSTSNNDAYTAIGFQLYAPIPLSGWTLLPNVAYESISYSSSNSLLTTASLFEVGAAARFAF